MSCFRPKLLCVFADPYKKSMIIDINLHSYRFLSLVDFNEYFISFTINNLNIFMRKDIYIGDLSPFPLVYSLYHVFFQTRVCLEMSPGLRINKLTLSLDLSCSECLLTSAIVSAGISMISMRKLATVRIDVSSSLVTLLENIEEVVTL